MAALLAAATKTTSVRAAEPQRQWWRIDRRMLTYGNRNAERSITGTVNLSGHERNEMSGCQTGWPLCQSGRAGDLGPGLEGLDPGGSILVSGQMIAAEMKEVVDPVIGGEETLCLAS